MFIQGCYSEDMDPHYDIFSSWVCLVPQSPVLPGGETTFYFDTVEDPITHIRMHLLPDGGIQQIKVMGKPAEKEAKPQLLIEQAPEIIVIEEDTEVEDDDITAIIVEEILDTPAIQQLSTVTLSSVNQPPTPPAPSKREKRPRTSA